MNTTTEYTVKQNFEDYYSGHKELFFNGLPKGIVRIKEEAFALFKKEGFPTNKMEEWRFTHLANVIDPSFDHVASAKNVDFKVADMFHCDVPQLDTYLLTFFNGFMPANGSQLIKLDNGVIMGSFAAAIKEYPHIVEAHYNKYTDRNDSLVALNTAIANDGVFVYVPRNVVVDKPIQIVNVVSAGEDIFIEHRNLIVVEENASVKMVICDHSLYFNKSFVNSVTEAKIARNAQLEYYRIQNSSNNTAKVAYTFVDQERNSRFLSNVVTLHSGFVRNNINVELNGEGADTQLYGIYLTDREQHIDNHTRINHNYPYCTSNEKYKGILDDKGTGVFTGRVVVKKDAQHTNAFQSNNNILLTDEARMNTKPQLEIYADDVKCSHGATVGQLDDNAMFYLQARGISKHEARMMLMYAFANEIVNQIHIEPLRERIDDLVAKRLRGELSRCNNCSIKCG